MTHRSVESNPWSLTQLRVHRVQRRAFQITRHPHLPAGAPWHPTQRRVTAGPSRSLYGLVTFVTISVPPAMLPTSSPTSRFIVASSSSGTQHHRLGVLGHSGSSSVPTSPLPPAWSQLIDDARHLASSAPARAARRASAPPARLAAAPVTSPLCLPLRRPVTAPQPEIVPTSHADVAVADRAVVVRHRCSPSRERGAGSRRAPSERTACAPQPPPWHRLVTRALLDAHHRATARGRVGLPCRPRRRRPRCRSAATLLAPFRASAPAHAARRARAPLARLCRPVTSPRCSPLRCAHPAPPPEIMSTFPADVAAAARAVAARRLFLPLCPLGAGSRRVPS